MTSAEKVMLGAMLFLIAQTISWFQLNLQFLNEWWEDKGILAVIVFGIPCGLSFWYAWKFTTEGLGRSVWSARFVSFGISYLTFPMLTHFLLKESIMTTKTLLCIFLSICIVLIQIFT